MISVIKQVFTYMKCTNIQLEKLALEEKRSFKPIEYAMVTSYQISFLVKIDGSSIFVSHWFPREELLRLTYLLFLLRYRDYVPDEAQAQDFIRQIHDSFPRLSKELISDWSGVDDYVGRISKRRKLDNGSFFYFIGIKINN